MDLKSLKCLLFYFQLCKIQKKKKKKRGEPRFEWTVSTSEAAWSSILATAKKFTAYVCPSDLIHPKEGIVSLHSLYYMISVPLLFSSSCLPACDYMCTTWNRSLKTHVAVTSLHLLCLPEGDVANWSSDGRILWRMIQHH